MTHVCDAAAVTCDEGATACTEDGKLNSCADNVWTTSDCEADQVCPSGKDACEPIVCEGGNSVTNNVFVDGNIVWTRSGWPGNETENISQTNIDVSGSVDIRIETSQPLVTDNLKWMNNPLFSI